MRTANGRMSEAQAALALMELDCLDDIRRHNNSLQQVYQDQLNTIPGIKVLFSSPGDHGHHHVTLCEVDESLFGIGRNELVDILSRNSAVAFTVVSEWHPETHPNSAAIPLTMTENLAGSALCIINNASISQSDAIGIIDSIRNAHRPSATPSTGGFR